MIVLSQMVIILVVMMEIVFLLTIVARLSMANSILLDCLERRPVLLLGNLLGFPAHCVIFVIKTF